MEQAQAIDSENSKPRRKSGDRHHKSTAHFLIDQDAAAYCGFAYATWRQQRMKGRGPAFHRMGRTIRYRPADLDRWLNCHRVETHETGDHNPAAA